MPTIKKILSAGLLSALLMVSNLSSSVSAEDSTPATTPAPGTSNPEPAPPAANPPQPEEPPATSPSTPDPAPAGNPDPQPSAPQTQPPAGNSDPQPSAPQTQPVAGNPDPQPSAPQTQPVAGNPDNPAPINTTPAQPADPPATEPAAAAETPAPREHPLLNPPAAATVSTPAARPDQSSRTSTNLPQTATLNEGLVAYYPFNENANDESGNSHNGTVNGATLTEDRFGKAKSAYSFDGKDDYIGVPDNEMFTLGSDPFTISVWVNVANIESRGAPFLGHDEGGGEYNKWVFWLDSLGHGDPSGLALRFHLNSPTFAGLDPVYALWNPNRGQWYHTALTRNGDVYTLYINGLNVATRTNSSTIPNPQAEFTIGKAEAFFFNGSIDDIRLYNRALTATEVQALSTASDPADNTDNNTQTEVEIRPGTLTITPPQTVNFGATTVSSSEQTLAVDLSAPNYFSVEDLKGAAAGYYTTLQVTDLSAGSKTIAAKNLKLKVTDGTVHTLGGSEDTNVKVPAKTQAYLPFPSSSPATLLERSADSEGLVGKYGVLPSFQLTIPAYQTLGSYTGTITYTLIEN